MLLDCCALCRMFLHEFNRFVDNVVCSSPWHIYDDKANMSSWPFHMATVGINLIKSQPKVMSGDSSFSSAKIDEGFYISVNTLTSQPWLRTYFPSSDFYSPIKNCQVLLGLNYLNYSVDQISSFDSPAMFMLHLTYRLGMCMSLVWQG